MKNTSTYHANANIADIQVDNDAHCLAALYF